MRKLTAALAVVGLVAILGVPAGAAGKGELRVATSLPAPGFWNGDRPDDITGGYEAGIAEELATRLGYDGYSLRNVSFDALVAGKAKGFDVAFSQVTITKERARVVAFTRPYFSSDQGVLVAAGTTVDETNAKTIQWGVQTATTAQSFLEDELQPEQEPRSYQETTQAFAALQAGQVDAVMLDTAIVLAQANESNGEFEVVGQFRTGESYGGIMPKGKNLKKQINRAIKAMDADGTLSTLADEFLAAEFGQDPQKVPFLEV